MILKIEKQMTYFLKRMAHQIFSLSLSLSLSFVCLFVLFLKYEEPILGPVVFLREHIIANLLCGTFF